MANDPVLSYEKLKATDKFFLPITPKDFEALYLEICRRFELPEDDRGRQVLAGFIHHVPNTEDMTTLSVVGTVVRKSIANTVSWDIDQAIKKKNAEKEAAAQAAIEAAKAPKQEESTPAQVACVDSHVQAATGS